MSAVMAETLQGLPESARTRGASVPLALRSDRELAAMVDGGDGDAFEEVYRRHSRRVYSLCMRMTQNASEAEDITQEVFIHLFRKIGSFRGESAFTTWLHRMTVNQVLMHFRKTKARKDRTTEDGTTPEPPASNKETAGRLPVIDRMALDKALAELPPGYRAVFILHDVEGYEHEEVAKILGCAAGTSKSQLHKARTRLRKLLGGKP